LALSKLGIAPPGRFFVPAESNQVISPILPVYAPPPDLAFERGEGSWLIAADGRRFLDFGSGIAVTALGHAHPHLVKALQDQAAKLWHTSNLFRIPGQERLAQRLVDNTFADTVFFTNSGTEAVECGIKLVRKYFDDNGQPERYRLIGFEGSFHGRTMAALAAAGNKKYIAGFEPAVEGFDHVPFGDHEALLKAIGPETAGIILEPVQGEGGVRPFDPAYLRKLRALCDEKGLLLFFDEVQSGMGRTGKLFAHEHAGITPDVMAAAKGLGGGFPVGACLATEKVAKGMKPGNHGSTFGGNPLAMAVGNAVLDVMLADGFLAEVEGKANYLWQQMGMLAERHPDVIEETRGSGLLFGIKCRKPNTDLVDAMRARGLLTVTAGDNVIRILPPLTVSQEEISKGVAIIDDACGSLQ
jgi:acetylornithine/N-succinyldiaminopimelate aminotransferase